MARGKVKWYDADKGFGFLSQDEGEDVYVRSDALAEGVDTLHPRQRVEFDMVSGRRGPQALRVEVLETPGKPAAAGRSRSSRTPDQLHGMIEDMITLLDSSVQSELRRGRMPDAKVSARVAEVLRAVAGELG